MDKAATRAISSALTMFDIMERRITLVEQLAINRQPFPEMDVIYLVSPTVEAVRKISNDFENRQKAKYGNVHLFFIDSVRSFPLPLSPHPIPPVPSFFTSTNTLPSSLLLSSFVFPCCMGVCECIVYVCESIS